MNKRYRNSRVQATVEKYDGKLENLDEPLYLDAYNKNIREDGVYGCIRCGEDFRNMSFMIVPIEFRGGNSNNQQVTLLNSASDNTFRCIRSSYFKVSLANFLHHDGRAASAIIEFID